VRTHGQGENLTDCTLVTTRTRAKITGAATALAAWNPARTVSRMASTQRLRLHARTLRSVDGSGALPEAQTTRLGPVLCSIRDRGSTCLKVIPVWRVRRQVVAATWKAREAKSPRLPPPRKMVLICRRTHESHARTSRSVDGSGALPQAQTVLWKTAWFETSLRSGPVLCLTTCRGPTGMEVIHVWRVRAARQVRPGIWTAREATGPRSPPKKIAPVYRPAHESLARTSRFVDGNGVLPEEQPTRLIGVMRLGDRTRETNGLSTLPPRKMVPICRPAHESHGRTSRSVDGSGALLEMQPSRLIGLMRHGDRAREIKHPSSTPRPTFCDLCVEPPYLRLAHESLARTSRFVEGSAAPLGGQAIPFRPELCSTSRRGSMCLKVISVWRVNEVSLARPRTRRVSPALPRRLLHAAFPHARARRCHCQWRSLKAHDALALATFRNTSWRTWMAVAPATRSTARRAALAARRTTRRHALTQCWLVPVRGLALARKLRLRRR